MFFFFNKPEIKENYNQLSKKKKNFKKLSKKKKF